jgi:hypothetical protein
LRFTNYFLCATLIALEAMNEPQQCT